MIMFQVTHW